MIRRALPFAAAALAAACNLTPGHIGKGDRVLLLDVDPEPIDKLDVLFVIDNSGSMEGQQEALVTAARDSLFGQLTAELGHLPDLHLGVTSSSAPMPANTESIGGCSGPTFVPLGGLLTINECPGIDGNFLVDEDDGAGGRTRNYQGDLADNFACMGRLGVSGCGFESPLAAMSRALDQTLPENAGFLRDDAFLLVVFVSDEDDCSADDGTLFGDPVAGPTSVLGPRTSFRCFEFGVACAEATRELGAKTDCTALTDGFLHPIDDFVFRLRGARPDPTRILVAGIHGDDHDIAVVPDAIDPTFPALGPLCAGSNFEVAPAVRLTTFERSFPARWIQAPACLTSTAAKVTHVARATAGLLDRSTCLLGPAPDADSCRVDAVSPAGVATEIPRCQGGAGNDCYQIGRDAVQCGYTDHQLHLVVPPAMVPAGHRLQARCAVAGVQN